MIPVSLIQKFSDTPEHQERAVFNTLFIVSNRLQTLFDSHIPELSLKQFMLLSVARHSEKPLTFTALGNLLGCSRQNIKKLASALEKKGFVTILSSPEDSRALCLHPTEKTRRYFEEDFLDYQKELRYLFEVYTEEELSTLFCLFMKLYKGIEHLEHRINEPPHNNQKGAPYA